MTVPAAFFAVDAALLFSDHAAYHKVEFFQLGTYFYHTAGHSKSDRQRYGNQSDDSFSTHCLLSPMLLLRKGADRYMLSYLDTMTDRPAG